MRKDVRKENWEEKGYTELNERNGSTKTTGKKLKQEEMDRDNGRNWDARKNNKMGKICRKSNKTGT